MPQTASRPTYYFIPKPVERQLAAYQLGLLLDHYQWGWKRQEKGDRPTSFRLLGLLLTPIGLVSTYFSMIITYDTIQMSGLIAPGLILIPALPVCIAVIGIASLFRASPFCLVAFSEGLVYAKKTRITIVHWHEIVWCEQKTTHTSIGAIFHKYTIRTHAGKSLRWKVADGTMQNLAKIIDEHIV